MLPLVDCYQELFNQFQWLRAAELKSFVQFNSISQELTAPVLNTCLERIVQFKSREKHQKTSYLCSNVCYAIILGHRFSILVCVRAWHVAKKNLSAYSFSKCPAKLLKCQLLSTVSLLDITKILKLWRIFLKYYLPTTNTVWHIFNRFCLLGRVLT